MAKRKSDEKLLYAIGVTGLIAFFLSKKALAAPAIMNTGNVQTAIVGDRVYSITKLGQGHYLVSLVSTSGVLERTPVNYVFNQTQQLGATGDERKLAQLRTDMHSFRVNFAA